MPTESSYGPDDNAVGDMKGDDRQSVVASPATSPDQTPPSDQSATPSAQAHQPTDMPPPEGKPAVETTPPADPSPPEVKTTSETTQPVDTLPLEVKTAIETAQRTDASQPAATATTETNTRLTTKPIISQGEEPEPVPLDSPIEEMQDLVPPFDEAAEVQVCPVCGQRYRVGELACTHCGYVFLAGGRTHKFEDERETSDRKSWPTGDVLAIEQKPIHFEIDGKKLTFLVSEVVTVGRSSDIANDIAPDVDLNPFNAGDLGVSRRHIRIRRKGTLIYVADLNSTNGTLLNGRRLIPEGERLLRSGDELRLGHLKIRVRF